MFFDFNEDDNSSTESVEDMVRGSKKKLDIMEVLRNIDRSNFAYFDSLTPDEQDMFTPYTVLRWLCSLDDSKALTFPAKNVEAVFGKWSKDGKKSLGEFKDAFNEEFPNGILNVSKFEFAKYDWRIKFSVSSDVVLNTLRDMLNSEFGIRGADVITMVDSENYKTMIMVVNQMVNKNFWDYSNNKELMYQVMCSVGSMMGGIDFKRTWLPFIENKKSVDQEVFDIFKGILPTLTAAQLNLAEYKLLLSQYNTERYEKLLGDLGYQESELKAMIKRFNNEKEKFC